MRALLLVLALLPAIGCSSMQANAQKDPMKCERDPKCTEKNRVNDCSRQCSDDPACVDRCMEINRTTGGAQR
jgi:hypothetical protein